MYNLKINGQRVTNLRLSGANVAKIFTGAITSWDDPAIKADNPGLALPNRKVVPVVRSDGSGSSAQFTRWMIAQHGGIWNDYCNRSGRAPACGFTSFYPTIPGMIAQSGDLGVAGYVAQAFAEGAIGYVNYSYALGARFPVAKVLNAAGYYTEPTPENVSVSLLQARINTDETSDEYLTQQLDDVYTDPDPRNYQLSSYSYFILPTRIGGQFNEAKGKTLGAFAYYAMCQAQQQSASLGYSPMPINLVQASFDQIRKIPGVVVQDINITSCKNPTFSPDGTNVLAKNAPMPPACDKQGGTQCSTGTGGLKAVVTAVNSPGASGGAGGGGAAGAGTGGATAGGAGAGGAGTGSPSAPGGQGAGGASGGTGAPADAGTGTAAPACDPDTGVCASSDGSGAGVGSGSVGTVAGAVPGVVTTTLLAGSSGWSSAQTLMVLVFVLTLALVLAPAAAWRHLAGRGRP
jgi:ABC-type phosphate transport system substrate-binding protein